MKLKNHDTLPGNAGIAAPVSICMALTVILVRLLNPNGDSDSGAVGLASLYYTEEVCFEKTAGIFFCEKKRRGKRGAFFSSD